MRQFVFRYWVMLSVVAMAWTLSGCGTEPELVECERSSECGVGEVCFQNECLEEGLGCFDDSGCASFEICQELRCTERTSCESQSQCAPGKTCSNGSCVNRQCNNASQCFSGQVCDEGICRNVPRQCTSVGQTCNPAEATRTGWACDDLGEGDRCYRECTGNRACIDGQPGTSFSCAAGSLCVSGVTQGAPVCQPSQCRGFLSAEQDCGSAVSQDPEAFADGVQCSDAGGGTFLCEPAGLASEGTQCASNSDCQQGLLCVNGFGPFEDLGSQSFCASPCTSDSMCDGDQQCIGGQQGQFHGVGFCGDRCEPFGTDEAQCSSNVACVPVTGQDGVCFRDTTRARALYETCANDRQCGDNAMCVGLAQNESRCLPMCNSTLGSQAARDSTCPSATTEGFVQLAHFGQGVPDVDVFVDGVEATTLSPGQGTEGYFSLEQGAREVELRLSGTSTTIFTDTLQIGPRDALTIAAVALADGSAALLVNTVDRGITAGAQQASLRFVHGVAGVGIVDVVLVTEGGSVTSSNDRIAIIEGLAYGDASSFATLDLGDEEITVDAYLLPPQSFDDSNAFALFSGVEVPGGLRASIYAIGDVQPVDEGDQLAPELFVLPYASAPAGRQLGGYCIDLNTNGPPSIGTGVCLETCRNSNDWGGGSCSNSRDSCSTVGSGLGWCFPSGTRAAGASCEDDDECGDALFCDGAGSESGVCRSYCQTTSQTNPNLGCASGETCIPRSGYTNFGECRIACTPDENRSDANCPVGMRNCLGEPGRAYCSPSGTIELGEACGDPRQQECAPGLVCAQNGTTLGEVITGPFAGPRANQVATCREICTPFTSNSGCSEGFACSPITPDGESTVLGHCVESVETPIPSLDDCAASEIGKMCDENSFCIEASSNQCVPLRGQCLQLCDFATGRGCSGSARCIEGFVGGPLLGVFGLCQ